METSLLLRILDVSRRMVETRAFGPLLNYVVEQAIELVGAERGYIVLARPDGSLDFRVTRDQQGQPVSHPEDQVSTSVLKKILQTGEPLILRDATADPNFSASRSVMALNLRSVMAVPLISYGQTLGVIYVENRLIRNRFKEDDLPPLILFAHQAMAALENATLNDNLEERVAARTRELEQARAELEKSWLEAVEANRLRILLLSKIAHDLRSPLSLADNILEMMGSGMLGSFTSEQSGWLEKSHEAVGRSLRLTNDVVDLTKLDLGNLQIYPEPVDLASFLHRAYELAHALTWPNDVEFCLEIESDLPQIEIDPGRIEQVLMNLLSNAIKFTTHGSVTLHAHYHAEGQEVVIGVADTGEGLPDDQVDQLFQRFKQIDPNVGRRKLGSGLGLSICKELVEMQGGRIWVESVFGEGANFMFALPVNGSAKNPA